MLKFRRFRKSIALYLVALITIMIIFTNNIRNQLVPQNLIQHLINQNQTQYLSYQNQTQHLINENQTQHLINLHQYLSFQNQTQHLVTQNSHEFPEAIDRVVRSVDEISNMEKVVLPNQSTVILEPFPNVTCQDSGNGLFLLLIVISSPANVKSRDVIRTTFLEMEPLWEEYFYRIKAKNNATKLEVGRVFQLLFLVGQSAEPGASTEIREEWKQHGDVIVDDLVEAYLRLTVKTLRMLKWVLHNCPSAKYLVKMDDDVFLNMPKLFSFLLTQPNGYNPLLIAGHVYDRIAPNRDPTSKWFSPKSVWPKEHLPRFVAGFCYVLGLKAARETFEESRSTPLFHLEDVFLTGIVASERLKYNLTDPGNILTMFYPQYQRNSVDWLSKMLIIHHVSLEQIRCWTRDTSRGLTNDSLNTTCH